METFIANKIFSDSKHADITEYREEIISELSKTRGVKDQKGIQ